MLCLRRHHARRDEFSNSLLPMIVGFLISSPIGLPPAPCLLPTRTRRMQLAYSPKVGLQACPAVRRVPVAVRRPLVCLAAKKEQQQETEQK